MTTFGLLGPLEVFEGGERIELGAGRHRAVLALLLLHRNEALSTARFVDLLWDEPPPSATKIVQNCVVRLRRLLPDGVLLTRSHGYELRLADGELDADRFHVLVADGRIRLANGDAEAACSRLDAALELWRGTPLADIGDAPFVAAHVRRLEALLLDAQLDHADALLQLGRTAEAVRALERLLEGEGLNERIVATLMLALYRDGRQTDALAVFRSCRARLVDELGVEPRPALRELERAILRQDTELELAVRALPQSKRRRRIAWSAVALGAAIAALAAVLVVARGGDSAPFNPGNAVAVIDARSGHVDRQIPMGINPGPIAADSESVYVVNYFDGSLRRVDARNGYAVARAMPLGTGYTALTSIADVGGTCWVAESVSRTVIRFNSFGMIDRVRLPVAAGDSADTADPLRLAVGGGRVWIVRSGVSRLVTVDAERNVVLRSAKLPAKAIDVAWGAGAVWTTSARHRGGALAKIDPRTLAIRALIPLPAVPTAVATAFGRVWVALASLDEVVAVDPRTGVVVQTATVHGGPIDLASGGGSVWVATGHGASVVELDGHTARVLRTVSLPESVRSVAVSNGKVWVA